MQDYAKITREGRVICPKCGRYFGKALYGARARGIEFWCPNCKRPVLLKINE